VGLKEGGAGGDVGLDGGDVVVVRQEAVAGELGICGGFVALESMTVLEGVRLSWLRNSYCDGGRELCVPGLPRFVTLPQGLGSHLLSHRKASCNPKEKRGEREYML
jgi:hypothetical protein